MCRAHVHGQPVAVLRSLLMRLHESPQGVIFIPVFSQRLGISSAVFIGTKRSSSLQLIRPRRCLHNILWVVGSRATVTVPRMSSSLYKLHLILQNGSGSQLNPYCLNYVSVASCNQFNYNYSSIFQNSQQVKLNLNVPSDFRP